jgi:antitoxin component YwqK of YwqJK toxin-antitoxin module
MDGSVKREGFYYKNFRTGEWREYYPNGALKSESYYNISKSDSLFNRQLTERDYKNIVHFDTLTWGEADSSIIKKGTFYSPTIFNFPYLVSNKTGVWKTYDSNGNLFSKINYVRNKNRKK